MIVGQMVRVYVQDGRLCAKLYAGGFSLTGAHSEIDLGRLPVVVPSCDIERQRMSRPRTDEHADAAAIEYYVQMKMKRVFSSQSYMHRFQLQILTPSRKSSIYSTYSSSRLQTSKSTSM